MWVEVPSLTLSQPLLGRARAGDNHPVMLFPAFICPEQAMIPLRNYLRGLGYDAETWGLGINMGLATLGDDLELVEAAFLKRYKACGGQKLSLIGWSLGGIAAREMARRHPEKIRQVITMASPFNGCIHSVRAVGLMRRLAGVWGTSDELQSMFSETNSAPAGVPSTAIFSKTDGIVPWTCAVEDAGAWTDNIEVIASHIGIALNPTAFYAIADRLALQADAWAPFDRSAVWKRFLYPSCGHYPELDKAA